MIILSWTSVLMIILASVAMGFFLRKPLVRLYYFLSKRYRLIKAYWAFSFIFCLLAIFVYWVIFTRIPLSQRSDILNVASNGLTLTFAIFVGYFAFAAVVDSRLHKFKERGDHYISLKRYPRAIEQYEEAFKINNKDFEALANLLEAYLINKSTSAFDERFPVFDKFVIDGEERVCAHYLLISKDLLISQNLQSAKQKLAILVEYIKTHPRALNHFIWNFSDITQSDPYTSLLATDDVRVIFDNLTRYLRRNLSEEEKSMFETGNYKLVKS